MKVTAIEEYGLRCLLLLARNIGASTTLSEISEKEGLSIPYATKLLTILRKSRLVTADRGRYGGYLLARSPEQVTLGEVMNALGEPLLSSGHCKRYGGRKESCVHAAGCEIRSVWMNLDRVFSSLLDSITLADLVSGGDKLHAFGKLQSNSLASRKESTAGEQAELTNTIAL